MHRCARWSARVVLLGIALGAGWSPPTPQDIRVVTKLDDVTNAKNGVCWTLVPTGDRDARRLRCPGLDGWRVEMVSSGRQTYLTLGKPAGNATAGGAS